MVKHKSQRPLFDLLRKERQEGQGDAGAKPAPGQPPGARPVIRAIGPTATTGKPRPIGSPAAPVGTPRPVSRPTAAPVGTPRPISQPRAAPAAPPAPAVPAAQPQRRVLAETRPVIRPAQPPPASAETAKRGEAGLGLAAILGKPVVLTYSHLAIALVGVICLCVIVFVIASRFFGPGETLPVTEKHPTFPEVQAGGVTPNLVAPGPTRPAPVAPSPGPRPVGPAPGPRSVAPDKAVTPLPMPRPAGPEKVVGPEPAPVPAPAAPSGPRFRVRIAQLPVSQPNIIDRMREFLSQKGVETELETHSGYYILYGRDRFPDKKKSDEVAGQINKHLTAFEKQTRIPTSNDAYSVQTKE